MSFTADGLLADGSPWQRADATPADVRSKSRDRAVSIGDGSDEDLELLDAAVGGDEEAFVALYGKWQGPLFRFVLHLSGSESLAEDVTQEVFVALAGERQRFDASRGHVSGYLFGMARNLALRRLRREHVYESMDEEGTEGRGRRPRERDAAGQESSPEAALDRRDAVARVRLAVSALPLAYREAIALCDLQEMSYADAAAVLGCPVGTVRSRLHRGRALLADWLTRERAEQERTASDGPASDRTSGGMKGGAS